MRTVILTLAFAVCLVASAHASTTVHLHARPGHPAHWRSAPIPDRSTATDTAVTVNGRSTLGERFDGCLAYFYEQGTVVRLNGCGHHAPLRVTVVTANTRGARVTIRYALIVRV